ncbi:hypothetical protein [Solicola sp. PLA-1-18]|uniref:hypothetical protein n=1 Tax=Solicola sp. PLA-1-18 TaxID=3380532 RepID=UPI003B7D25D6
MPYPTREPDDFVPFPLGKVLGIGAMVSVAVIVILPMVEALGWPYWADLLLAMGVGLAGGILRNVARRLWARRATTSRQQASHADGCHEHAEGYEGDPHRQRRVTEGPGADAADR